ncbi:MAG: dihydrolipoamide acyltransferase [Variovorax paradoxus]|nr:MAG: dihydrolipoamide acyltransferase [Variovorax paradoxus]PZQ05239.1 MAG: dihydrolipoamide acyltransferase [Variovorax paradoxus]
MRREWLMPKLGLTMTEGVLAEWTVAPGARFKRGDCVFVVENDKAASEIAAESGGVMAAPRVAVGETVAVGAVLGHWDDDAGAAAEPAALATAAAALAHRPVTPWARKLARGQGVDLAAVVGSGPRGRVRARDVEAVLCRRPVLPAEDPPAVVPLPVSTSVAAAPAAPAAPAAAAPAVARAGTQAGRLQPFTSLQQAAAARLTAAKQEMPHFYVAREVEVSKLLELHARLKDPAAEPRLTLNHFLVAAVGRALRALPELNRIWSPQGMLVLERSDVGVAVHTERGLLAPVVRDAGRLSLVALARQANTLAERARAGRLAADDMAGGAITVSNAGMHGLTAMSSIIVPGQAMILGVGGVRELFRPGAQGQPALQREIVLTLSLDHRVLDGVAGAALLNAMVEGLTHPTRLLFD